MGLKQMIDKAMQGDTEAIAALPPVEISGEATRAYGHLIRAWTGWDNATIKWGEPGPVSPFASCNRKTHVVTANPERLLLNPNRVLLMVTPFRLRQEAVLTGALLHEAAHARHSNWLPRSEIEADEFTHSDGEPVTKAEFALAKVAEEARIEGIMAAQQSDVGATDLAWTMRAMAAHVVPMTELSADPAQALIDLLGSWVLRAGRQVAIEYHVNHVPPQWVMDFTSLVHTTLVDHFEGMGEAPGQAAANALYVIKTLSNMCKGTSATKSSMFPEDGTDSDTGPWMVDRARDILSMLFPETPSGEMPQAGGGCGAGEGEGEGAGVTDLPEDGDEAGEVGAGEPTEGEGEESLTEGGNGAEDGEEDGEGEGSGTDTESDLAKALADMETTAKDHATEQGQQDEKESQQSQQGGAGPGSPIGGGWRRPTIAEREVKANAEKFLKDLIEPNVASKIRVTDQPSSMIDGAALAAWKAGGQVKAPRFFQQVKRTVKPTPPVKIAVLVDVSSSMGVLQKPSALLSWALAAACLDLRNYAGGGVQIESTLIHWGDSAEVIQRNGELLPGIRTVPCNDGTTAMHMAYEKIEEQIPDFFEVKDQPENKLVVTFTDWQLYSRSEAAASHWVGKALESGASMLSVVPQGYTNRHTSLAGILAAAKVQRGRNHLMQYNPDKPEDVWTTAASALGYGS